MSANERERARGVATVLEADDGSAETKRMKHQSNCEENRTDGTAQRLVVLTVMQM